MLNEYLKKISEIYKRGDYTEQSFRTPFQDLLQEFIKQEVKKKFNIIHEPLRETFGAPDFKITDSLGNKIGYIECKNIADDIEKLIDSEQIKKYLDVSNNLILTNHIDFILFKNGNVFSTCSICNKIEFKGKKPEFKQVNEFKQMFNTFFLSSPEKIKNSQKLSIELAKRTRILKDLILDELKKEDKNPFRKFYGIFQQTVIHDLDLTGFADIYAQIIGFGLFFLRLSREEHLTRDNILSNIPHYIPLLRDFFPSTHFEQWTDNILWILDEIIDLLNNIDSEFIKKSLSYKNLSILKERDYNLKDPFLYFYEEFLNIYDKKTKIKRGVFYTPEAVVSYIIRSLDIILKEKLGVKKGFLDTNIKILDFAVGTGTFILALIEHIKNSLWETNNMGLFNYEINEHILKNVYGFEYLIVPYIICHLRIHEFLESFGFKYQGNKQERAEIYLTNTLDNAASKPTGFFDEIDEEGQLADKVKNKEEILVIMGNPPYSKSSTNKTIFIEDLMKTYKKAVRKERNIQPLSDDYIKFIRFAQWKMENVKKGVVGIITNNSYIDGIIHRGMREELLKTFDEIYILNLHGSTNKEETCTDGSKDENVFDIRQGVSISFLIKMSKAISNKRENYYYDLLGLRDFKYEFLYDNNIKSTQWNNFGTIAPYFWFMEKDLSLESTYVKFISLKNIFKEYKSGIKTHKDIELIYFDKRNLKHERKYLYRPFDIRMINYDINKVVRHRISLMKHFINHENIGIIANRTISPNVLFNHVLVSSYIIDVRTIPDFGGAPFFFPLYLYSEDIDIEKNKKVNFSDEFQKYIKDLYSFNHTPEDIMGYIYAILYSPTYRTKYCEFLKIDFPRIPFTKDKKLFNEISKIGLSLINLHLLKTEFDKSIVNFPIENPNLKVEKVKYEDGQICINDTTYFEGVPEEVWKYEIGGYQVLDKWLKERKKHNYILTGEDVKHFIKVCDVLNETIKIQKEIDNLVKDWI